LTAITRSLSDSDCADNPLFPNTGLVIMEESQADTGGVWKRL
jgi:hypothetical protein